MSQTTDMSQLETTQQLYDQYVMTTYGRAGVVFERGEGAYLWDSGGRCFLDFLAGIAVNGLGHCHPKVVKAIQDQAAKLIHISNLYLVKQQGELASILCRQAGMEKAFFCNSGTEANEAALKIARKHGKSVSPTKTGLVAAEGSFHGRSMGALSVTAQPKYQAPFEPLIPGVSLAAWNDPSALRAVVGPDTCAIILEPIQGEMGVRPASQEFIETARHLANKFEAFLIFDEIQTGNGRTGNYFAWQSYGIMPDILTTAKAMGGGIPIGACMAHGVAAAVFQPGDHGTTYGGGPLACATAIAALSALDEENLLNNTIDMGFAFESGLNSLCAKFQHAEVRGSGLMLGMELNRPIAKDILKAAYDEGLLINAVGDNVLRFLPPLIIKQAQVDEALAKLEAAFRKVEG
ncbi:MAG: acetylornithine transaminase [Armatimonadota bacterium]